MQPTHDRGCKQPFSAKSTYQVVQGGDTAEKVISPKVSRAALSQYVRAVCRLSHQRGHAYARQAKIADRLGLCTRQVGRLQVAAVAQQLVRVERNGRANHVYPLWENIRMSDQLGPHVRSTPYIDPELRHQTERPPAAAPSPAAPGPDTEHAYAPIRQLPHGAAAVAVLKRRKVPIADVIAIAQRLLGYHAKTGIDHAGKIVHGFIADQVALHRDAAELAERRRDPDWRPPIPRQPYVQDRPKLLEPAYRPRHQSAAADYFAERLREVGVA